MNEKNSIRNHLVLVSSNKRPKRGVKEDEEPDDVEETKEEEVNPKQEEKAKTDSIINKLKDADKKSKALKVYFADKHIPNSGIYKVAIQNLTLILNLSFVHFSHCDLRCLVIMIVCLIKQISVIIIISFT